VPPSRERIERHPPERSPAALVSPSQSRGRFLLWSIAIILLILWGIGLAFKVAGGIIHLLLLIALVVVVVQFLRGRRGV
jgi:hypothetical protein